LSIKLSAKKPDPVQLSNVDAKTSTVLSAVSGSCRLREENSLPLRPIERENVPADPSAQTIGVS